MLFLIGGRTPLPNSSKGKSCYYPIFLGSSFFLTKGVVSCAIPQKHTPFATHLVRNKDDPKLWNKKKGYISRQNPLTNQIQGGNVLLSNEDPVLDPH